MNELSPVGGGSDSTRVLLVDDDESIRTMLTRILERESFAVTTARDGQEAIETLRDHGFDVVLLDLMMPRVDGFGVIQYLRDHQPTLLGHVIVMTAFTAAAKEKIEPTCKLVGKPFDIRELMGIVRDCSATA